MKGFKKFIAVILAALMISSCMPLTALAETVQWASDRNWLDIEDGLNYSGNNHDVVWNYDAETNTLYFNSTAEDGIIHGDDFVITKGSTTKTYDGCLPLYTDDEDGNFFCYAAVENFVIGKDVKAFDNVIIGDSVYNYFGESAPWDATVTFEEGSQLESVGFGLFAALPITSIDLPSTVTEIGDWAFAETKLEEITIPENCTVIGESAFYYNEYLKNVNFNDKLTEIKAEAFQCCTVLESVELPDSVLTLGTDCFSGCENINNLKLSNSLTEIPGNAFSGIENLGTVELPAGIKEIGYGAFDHSKIENLILNIGLELIGHYAFSYCDLGVVNIPSTVSYIGDSAFSNSTLTELNFTENGEEVQVGSYAFSGCTNLTELYLPGRVWDVLDYAFRNCTALESVKFGTATCIEDGQEIEFSNGFIEDHQFAGCSSLKTVELSPTAYHIGPYAFADTALTSINLQDTKVEEIESNAFVNTPIASVQFPETLRTMGSNAFKSCANLESVNLSHTQLVSLGSYAFAYTGVEDVELPDTLQTINSYCFAYTPLHSVSMPKVQIINANAFLKTNLETVVVPEGCTTVEDYAFADCSELVSVTLPSTLKVLDTKALASPSIQTLIWPMSSSFTSSLDNTGLKECRNITVYGHPGTKLETFCEDNAIPYYLLSGDSSEVPTPIQGTWENGTYRITGKGGRLYIIGSGILTNKFTDEEGNTYTALELAEKYNITKITFEGVTAIPDGLFDNAENVLSKPITVLTLNSSITSIGNHAFRNLGLTTVNFFEGIDTIGDSAFADNKIKTVSLPDSVKTIGDSAFINNSMTELVVPNNVISIGAHAFENVPIATLTLGSNIMSIGDYAFNNIKIKELAISNNVQFIGEYAFANNTTLATLTIGEGISIIPEGAFYNTGITSVVLKNNIISIGKKAFGNCAKLTSFTVKNAEAEIFCDQENPSNNAVGFNDNGQIANSDLIIRGQFISSLFDYSNDCGITFSGDKSTATYAGYLVQTTASPTPEKLDWFYYSSSKTMYISGSGYLNGKALYKDDGTLFTYKLDVERLIICPGITRIESSIKFINPTYVSLPSSLYRLTHYAFNDCTNLKTLTLPDSITEITESTFDGCTSLESIAFGNGLESIPDSTFRGFTSLKFVDLGGVQFIGRHAFEKCTNLQNIVISDSVVSVGAYAFNKSVSVQSVTIGKNVNRIDPYAFANLPLCEKVTVKTSNISTLSHVGFENSGSSTTGMSLIFDDSVTEANMASFGNVNVVSVKLGTSIASFINVASMPYLEKLEVSEDNKNFYSYYNCLYNSDNELVYAPETLKVVDIKPGTTKIGDSAFLNTELSTIILPEGVTAIGNSAFKNAKELKIIYMPESLVTIGDNAFENCVKLKTVSLPYSVETIGKQAFKKCTNLASVIFPDTLKEIGIEAFNSCDALTAVVIPETVETIGTGAFSYCANLKEVYVWNSVQDIMCYRSPKVNIYTMVGSPAYEYARAAKIPYNAYTDEDAFFDECAVKIDVLAGYLGFCADGHGDIEYLTVYEADCENDGFVIGVCEYCSEILEEVHVDALGHDYHVTASIPATALTKGVEVSTCYNCKKTHMDYTPATSTDGKIETHTVTGTVVIATDKTGEQGKAPVKNVSVVIDNSVEAVTDENGMFTLTLETGTYEATLTYAYGFTRTVYIVVEDEDINFETPIAIIGCDFNKDGKIDKDDLTLFSYVVSAKKDDPSYLAFVDMNNDGYINVKDRAYIQACSGIDSETFEYSNVIIQK